MKAITGFTVEITDEGLIELRAGDDEAEGHLWAIEKREVTWERLRAAAGLLGADVAAGVEARLERIIARQRQIAETYEARVRAAESAREIVERLEALR